MLLRRATCWCWRDRTGSHKHMLWRIRKKVTVMFLILWASEVYKKRMCADRVTTVAVAVTQQCGSVGARSLTLCQLCCAVSAASVHLFTDWLATNCLQLTARFHHKPDTLPTSYTQHDALLAKHFSHTIIHWYYHLTNLLYNNIYKAYLDR